MTTEASRVIAEVLAKAVADDFITHAYAAYGRLTEAKPRFAYGYLPESRDVFDLSSLTKALVTVPLVYRAIYKGEIALDSTIGAWLGVQRNELPLPMQALTIRSLLRHESGLPAWRNFWVNHLGIDSPSSLADPAQRKVRVLEVFHRVSKEIGTQQKSIYSDVGFLLLGLTLELKRGTDIGVQFSDFAMTDLGLLTDGLPLDFATRLKMDARMVPTAYCALRGRLLVGEVHDENCASLGGVTAHAGLFGTGEAICRYLRELARSPVGAAMLADNESARHIPPGTPPNAALLGLRQGADQSSETFGDGVAMGHLGFTGTAFWICPERRDYAILLTNRVHGGRQRPGIQALRREVFRALEKLSA